MERKARRLAALAGSLALSISLSGCFLIPLGDGRSPFDDPFGPSSGSVERVIPGIADALKSVDSGIYRLEVQEGSDNCEGPCKLSPEVYFTYTGPKYENPSSISGDLLARVLIAAIPATDGLPLRLKAGVGTGDIRPIADIIEGLDQNQTGLYYSEYFDGEIYIPADRQAEVKLAAEHYLEEQPSSEIPLLRGPLTGP